MNLFLETLISSRETVSANNKQQSSFLKNWFPWIYTVSSEASPRFRFWLSKALIGRSRFLRDRFEDIIFTKREMRPLLFFSGVALVFSLNVLDL